MPPFSTAAPGGSHTASPAYVADLHIHSRYSRACSRDLDMPTLAWWARRKGIAVLGTGDFTHPAWYDHLREALEPAEPGLYRLRPDLQADVDRRLPPRLAAAAGGSNAGDVGSAAAASGARAGAAAASVARAGAAAAAAAVNGDGTGADGATRFMLSVEISTIYKRDDRTRKVHHLIYLPDLEAVARFNTALGRIGNLGADGRPILGLDSRDLLDIALTASPDGYLVPAHIWTPWFSALGSKSGFDAIADCYADLAEHIFAVETGLSSDPAMNWRVSSLDSYRLVSNSDAHSAPALGREATVFATGRDYFSIRHALRTGEGLHGTIEFFPEEGKYHADGHRACGVNWQPGQTRAAGGRCPECTKPLTVGVLSRVEELADRPEGVTPERAPRVTHLVPLAEVLGEINGVGPRSKTVAGQLHNLVAALGPELEILTTVPVEDLRHSGGELLAEAITRLRRGQVRRIPGYDGEYGVITLFEPGELGRGGAAQAETLFDVPVPKQRPAPVGESAAKVEPKRRAPAGRRSRPEPPPPIAPPPQQSPHEPFEPMLAGMEEVGTGLLDKLDALQRVAASAPGGPLLIVAGPGTGKTRTLTHRIAYLCAELGVFPEHCLAITFTRRAAEELRARLDALLGPVSEDVTVATFHSLGLAILRENTTAAGLPADFRIADETERAAAWEQAGGQPGAGRRGRRNADVSAEDLAAYHKVLRGQGLVDLDELVTLPLALLRDRPALVERYRDRWRWIFVDEYQDVDADQYELLRLLAPADGNLCAIGDPDQAIYSFRGADVEYFLRFSQDFTDARLVRLTRNYRSSAPILAAAVQAIAPSSLVRGRRLDPARLDPEAPLVGRYAAGSTADEADFVVRTIDELVGGLSHRSLDSGRVDGRAATQDGLSFGDIAVLYRTDAQATVIVDALSRAGVPVQKRSHNRLRDRPGVGAIARELRHAGGLGGSIAARVRLAGQVMAQRYAVPTLDEGMIPAPAGAGIPAGSPAGSPAGGPAGGPVGAGIPAGSPAGTGDAAARPGALVMPEDVWAAVELLTPLALRCGDDLELFLTEIATGAEVDALDPRAEAVTLLTLHAAKGLEFPVVFLVGCEDGLLPLRLPGSSPSEAEIAEERRLFFVGLTRAQDRLYVSSSARRFRHGAERECRPTPFLDAIDAGLFERLGDAGPRRPRDRQLRLI